ncbi:Ig-like domain-containing protein [Limnobacter sp.]|uniref:PKD domain-containing protein n=1 Tax=Limnobacter sp. TaxID=2003368 RepID=UPI003748B2DE
MRYSCFAHIVLFSALLAACNGNGGEAIGDAGRIEGQENLPSLRAGSDQQAAERSTIELRAAVQNTDQNSVVAYAWFPASEETVFFGDAGRSDESVLNLQLPQVTNDTSVEFVVQAQLSNGTVLEDRVQITIRNTFDNAMPVVNTTVAPIGLDNRLAASACESTDSDGTIQTYQWRNETLNIQYEETSCNLNEQLPNSPESQTYTLRAIAIDNEDGLGFKLFNVATPNRPANTAPVIQNASALPEPVRPGETLTLQANASDADGDTLFYRWTQTAGTMLTVSNADKAMAQVQIPPDLANQTLTFRIEVSDRANFQASVSQRNVDASVRSNTSSNAGLLECLQDPTRLGCPLAGLLSAPPVGVQQPNSAQFSAGQCTPFYGAGANGQGYSHLLGAMHEHTAYSDGQANTDPLQVYQQTRERGMNFVMSSDHSDNLAIPLALPDPDNCTDNPLSCLISDPDNLPNSLTKWRSTLNQANQVTGESPGLFTAMRGFEWTSDRFEHANVYLSKHNINAKLGPGYAVSMDLFWQWFVLSPQLGGGGDGLMVFNHPGREDALHSALLQIGEGVGQATRMAGALGALNVFQQGDPAYAFNDFKYVAPADYRVVGLEVFGKGDEYDTDGKFGSWYGHALDKGWYLGPAGSEDHHETNWGGANLPKTVVIARANNQADIREAFLARRFYTVAQNENTLRMNFEAVQPSSQSQQRLPMGSRIGTRSNTVQFEVNIRSTQPMDPLQDMSFELFSSQSGPATNETGNYQPLKTQAGRTGRFEVEPDDGKNWYFVRVKRGDRIVAVSAPIWVFKGSDPLPECAPL